jgi:hypothetical protein
MKLSSIIPEALTLTVRISVDLAHRADHASQVGHPRDVTKAFPASGVFDQLLPRRIDLEVKM